MEDDIVVAKRQAQELTFLKKNTLTVLQKKLKGLNTKALEYFEKVLNLPDDEVEMKVKLDVAKHVSKMYTEVSDAITKQDFQNLMAEVKVKGLLAKPNLKEVDGEQVKPTATYTTQLIDVDKLDGDYEDGEVFEAGDWDVSGMKQK